MKIKKSGLLGLSPEETASELAEINAFTRREMKAEELYTFTVHLCDNEVDRDFERFSDECLQQLSELFIGKTGVTNHDWSAQAQLARIYRTEVVPEVGRTNSVGANYLYLKAWAYIPSSEKTASFIEAIESGIMKETSVGCSVATKVCSICGENAYDGCAHIQGKEYDGQICHTVLSDATDAYEWSFVAVPAQREAGVIKAYSLGKNLREFVKSHVGKSFADEYTRLCAKAKGFDTLMSDMKNEVFRLALLWDEELAPSVKRASETMDAVELTELRKSLETKLESKFPPLCQLPGEDRQVRFDGDDYII